MGIIVCATRGGEASYRTQDAAITLAKEQNDTLLFLYVVDTSFLDKITGAGVVDTEQELSNMGQFLLTMAQERAAAQDAEAETVIYEGLVHEAVADVAHDAEASLIVFGSPGEEGSHFNLSGLEKMAEKIEEDTGVETRII
ncbi:MAG: hypothetical protein MAG431_00649 [Chloroflexi bacterium]|nr:hypothetical protein [Chloroflexota bacterium]